MDYGITGKKLKILFAVNEIFPDLRGGVHTYVYEVAKRLAINGHTIFILAKKIRSDLKDKEVIDGINIYRYNFKQYKLGFLTHISSIINMHKKFEELMKDNSFDLISVHSPHAAFGINLSAKGKALPRIYTFHALLHREEFLTVYGRKYLWYQWRRYIKPLWLPIYFFLMKRLENFGLKRCEKIVLLSSFTSECLVETHHIAKNKIVEIPSGVDVNRFKPATDKNAVRRKLELPLEKSILITVRRLVPRMGLDNLIKAMPAVFESYPNAILLIGGEGPLKLELQTLIFKLKLKDRVTLVGPITDEELPLYYQASDLFILPTRALEGFGIVTLEALSCGTPVLGTPVGATVEILSKFDKNLLFKDISSDSMSNKIVEYLINSSKRIGVQGRCRQFIVDNYSWEKIILMIEKLFLEVCGNG